jgi:hypothetical protein
MLNGMTYPQCGHARYDTADSVHRLRLVVAAKDAAPPLDVEIVRLTDVEDSVWPLSFWKEACRQYQCKWRAPNAIVYPVSGDVNSHIVERMLQLAKHNSLLTLVFFHLATPRD